jgi:putative addiction module component (TIGR02574 family)
VTLADVLPLARSLDIDDRLALAEEMWRSVDDSEPIDDEVLDLIEKRIAYIRQHPEESIPWAEFKAMMDEKLSPVPA